MRTLITRLPEEIIQKYNLNALAIDGWVYIEIRKGVYGLKQAGILANQLLQTLLAPFGYYPARHTPGLWLHKTLPISFTLVVDDFAVKYVGNQHAEHLRNALLRMYELTTDWTATVYSGMTLKWDYNKRICDISMHGYVSNVLSKFNTTPPNIHNTPHPRMSRLSTAPRLSMQLRMKHPLSLHNNVSQYKTSQDPFFTMQEMLILRF
jgi:hypothetical protein